MKSLIQLALFLLINLFLIKNVNAQGVQTFQSIRFYHPSNQEQYISLLPPNAITSYGLTLPAIQGTAGQVMVNDGTGLLSLTTPNGSFWGLSGNASTAESTNFIGTTDNIGVRFRTNNSERMTITNAGNVGIGTTTPTSKLDINGQLKSVAGFSSFVYDGVWGATATPQIVSLPNNGEIRLGYYSNGSGIYAGVIGFNNASNTKHMSIGTEPGNEDNIVFSTSAEKMRITASGNVGIGLSTPAYKLDINSTSNPLRISGLQAGSTADSVLTVSSAVVKRMKFSDMVAGNAWGLLGNAGTNAATNFIGSTDNVGLAIRTNNTKKLEITPAGRFLTSNGPGNAIFISAGNETSTGAANIGIGGGALTNLTTGTRNVVIGAGLCWATTTGAFNSFVGHSAYNEDATGSYNTGVGTNVMNANQTSSNYNTAMGVYAMSFGTNQNNVAIGANAMNNTTTQWATTTLQNNIVIGNNSGMNMDGASNNILLGYNINAPMGNGSNQLSIGNLIYGTGINGTGSTVSTGNIGIGTNAPAYKLDINSTSNPLRMSGLQVGTAADSVLTVSSAVVKRMKFSDMVAGNAWGLLGNAATVDGTNFIGTTDNVPLNFRVNNQQAGRIDPTALNTFMGYQSGNSMTLGGNNTAFGFQALLNNTTGNSNIALGSLALLANVTGNHNTALGINSLGANNAGTFNVAVGENALASNVFGMQNLAIGFSALGANLGNDNVALGFNALNANTTGNQSTAIGSGALQNSILGMDNVAVGFNSLAANTMGSNNVATGGNTLAANMVGTDNVAVGHNALMNSASGIANIAIGRDALATTTSGGANIAIGANAGLELNLPTVLSGGANIFVGTNTGRGIVTGINNTIIGGNVTGLAASLSNNIILADGAGNRRINVDATGRVGIGTTTPTQALHVIGNILATGTITSSDARFKKNIKPLENILTKVEKIRGVSYDFKTAEFPEHGFAKTPQIGFIAQELEVVFPEFVVTNSDGYKAVDYAKLTPVLVESVKELKKDNDELKQQLKEQNDAHTNELEQFKALLKAMENRINNLENKK